jgi:NAD+ synthase (glutamine-hydrolysing)
MSRLRVALAQVNPVVGDLTGNVAMVVDAIGHAAASNSDLVVFPELVVTGYPPEDLLLRPDFVAAALDALRPVAAATASSSCVAIVGCVDSEGGRLYNAAAVCAQGRVRGVYRKRVLPNYSVFDEQRYFSAGTEPLMLWGVAGVDIGITVCEDAWVDDGTVARLGEGGADVVVNINASPFHTGKVLEREHNLARRAIETGCPQVYVNLVGGQDELVFDGASMVVDASGKVVHRLESCATGLSVVDLEIPKRQPTVFPVVELSSVSAAAAQPLISPRSAPMPSQTAEVYEALVLGTRDYVTKNGFTDVVVGLSGGVDSTLVATVAVDALGSDHVHGVAMPSRYSSAHSLSDASDLATRLGIDFRTIPIESGHAALLGMLSDSFGDAQLGLTGENLQSRIRAVALMALSNQFGWLVLTTSNKSESAVGYSTLYGDSAGGLAVIKDVPKLLVYRLCRHRNDVAAAAGAVPPIPLSVLDKPPSAELRPDQRDDQSLPPYEILDPLLEAYVEGDHSMADLVGRGHDPAVAGRIVALVDGAEYKRRQSPPGLRVTTKAFGKDRRLPITNAYRG